MKPAMYIFINKGLGMSGGKIGAQAGHASVEAYKLSVGLTPHQPIEDQQTKESPAARNWYKGGHYAKYVMEAKDSTQLLTIRDYIEARGFKTALIVDEGHTEGTEFVPTALGVEVVDKDHSHVAATFGEFKLYNQPAVVILEATKKVMPGALESARLAIKRGDLEHAKAVLQPPKGPLGRFTDWLGRSPQ